MNTAHDVPLPSNADFTQSQFTRTTRPARLFAALACVLWLSSYVDCAVVRAVESVAPPATAAAADATAPASDAAPVAAASDKDASTTAARAGGKAQANRQPALVREPRVPLQISVPMQDRDYGAAV